MATTTPTPTPREVARIFFRHRRRMALVFGTVIALTLLLIAIFPRSYLAESKLFIRVGRESVALDPTATTGQTIMLQKTQADEVNSALDILSSREIQRRVVERVGARQILDDSPAGDIEPSDPDTWVSYVREASTTLSAWLDAALKSVRLSDGGTDVDLAMRRLEKGIRAWAPKESTIITVKYHAASPELAHAVVDATTQVFLEEHVRLNRSEGSLAFFSEQAETLHRELSAAQAELRDRKNAFQVASMAGRQALFEEKLKDVELELLRAQRELAFSEAKAADLTRAISGLEPELVTGRVAGFANEARDRMREKLYELEIQETKLRARYKDDHPLVTQIERQRKQAEEILTNLPDERTQTTSGLNPNQRELELQLLQARASSEAIQAHLKQASYQHSELHEQLQAINEQEVQIAHLERNVDLLENKYRMHVEKLEQARVNDALGRESISNVKVAQRATMMGRPVSPNKRMLAALGLIAAVGGALGMALVAESFDQTLRTTEQVERQLGLPVLASFPFRKRRRRAGPAIGASVAKSNGQARKQAGYRSPGTYQKLLRELVAVNGNGHRHAKTVGVVGCDTSKARSRVAAELAMQASCSGAGSVLLIDADARGRRVAKRFHVNESPGWREVLAGVADAESCIHRADADNLAVMAPGGRNGAALADAPMVGLLGQLDEIKNEYGLVVVDLPPGHELDGPAAAAEWLDEVVLVVEAERTRIHAARRAKAMLERAGVHLAGVVLANRREHIPRWLYRRL